MLEEELLPEQPAEEEFDDDVLEDDAADELEFIDAHDPLDIEYDR